MKNEIAILDLINKIQTQLTALDKKIDTLINRSVSQVQPSPKPFVNNAHLQIKSTDHNKGRMMHTAICADCGQECSIPFKPSGDRPVYCKDCFSRRKVIKLSGIKVDNISKDTPLVQTAINKAVVIPKAKVKTKKKVVAVKKSVGKKKPAPKRK